MSYRTPPPKARYKGPKQRFFTTAFQKWAAEEAQYADTVEGFAKEIGVSPTAINKWRRKYGVRKVSADPEILALAEEAEAAKAAALEKLAAAEEEIGRLKGKLTATVLTDPGAEVVSLWEELRRRNALAAELERSANAAKNAANESNAKVRELRQDLADARNRIAVLAEGPKELLAEVEELRSFALQVIRAGVRAGTVSIDFTKGAAPAEDVPWHDR